MSTFGKDAFLKLVPIVAVLFFWVTAPAVADFTVSNGPANAVGCTQTNLGTFCGNGGGGSGGIHNGNPDWNGCGPGSGSALVDLIAILMQGVACAPKTESSPPPQPQIDPNYEQAVQASARGTEYYKQGQYGKALQYFRLARSKWPGDWVDRKIAFTLVAVDLDSARRDWAQSRWRNAVDWYRRAMQDCSHFCSADFQDSIEFMRPHRYWARKQCRFGLPKDVCQPGYVIIVPMRRYD